MPGKTFDLSVIFRVVDKASRPVRDVGNSLKNLAKPVRDLEKRFRNLGRIVQKAGKGMRRVGKDLVLKLTAPLAAFGLMAVKSAADIETMTVAFESMLDSGKAAAKMVKDLIDFTAKTPFQLEGVGRSAKQLLAFGVEATGINETLKFLGDVAAGASVPLSDMAAIFGKAKAKGKAMTEELLQMSDRGVPIIDVLAKMFGVVKSAIFDMASKGQISFKAIEAALKSMAAEGGIFEDQMRKQSGTIAGLFSTLKDNVVLALGEIGDVLVRELDIKEGMKKLIVWIQEITKSFVEFAETHPQLTKFITKLILLAAAFGPLLIGMGLLASSIGAILALPLLTVILPVIAALGGVGAAIYQIIKYGEELSQIFVPIWRAWSKNIVALTGVLVQFGKDILGTLVWPIDFLFDRLMKVGKTIEGIGGFAKAFFGFGKVSALAGGESALTAGGPGLIADGGIVKSETNINIKLTAEPGTMATIERVRPKKGDAKVQVASVGYLGVGGF